MSDLQDIHEALGDKVKVYGLNVPAFGENPATLAAFVEQAGLTYPVMNHQSSAYEIDFTGNNSFPYPRDAVVDQHGVIVYTSNSFDSLGLRAIIDDLLENPANQPGAHRKTCVASDLGSRRALARRFRRGRSRFAECSRIHERCP